MTASVSPCASVGYAVGQAVDNDTIVIGGGTFTSTGPISFATDLEFTGNSTASTILKAGFNTAASDAWIRVQDGGSLDVNNLTIDGDFPTHTLGQGIRYFGDAGGTIDSVAFKNIRLPSYLGFAVSTNKGGAPDPSTSNLNVNNSTFENIGRVGVLYKGSGTTGSFTNNTYTGKGVGDFLDYALDISAGATVTVSGNTIQDNLGVASSDGSTSAAFLITTFWGAGTSADFTNNQLTNNTTGIAIGFDGADTSTVTVSGNTFTGNGVAISTTQTGPIALGPNNFDDNGDNVEPPAAFTGQPTGDLYVANGGSDSGNFCTDSGTPCETIQHAVDVASVNGGDTVNVAAGTYPGQVLVGGKTLTILGQGDSTVVEAVASMATLPGTGGNPIKPIIGADTDAVLEIRDLKLDGKALGSSNSRFAGAGFREAGGKVDNVTIVDIREPFTGPGPPPQVSGNQQGLGIYGFATAGNHPLEVTNSRISGFQKGGIAAGSQFMPVDLTDSTITCGGTQDTMAQNAAQIGFGTSPASWAVTESEVSGNEFADCRYGGASPVAAAALLLYADGGAGDVLVTGNDFDASDYSLIQGIDSDSKATFSDNTIADAGNGPAFGAGLDLTETDAVVSGNSIEGGGDVGLDLNGLGSAAQLSGNSIVGFATGVQVGTGVHTATTSAINNRIAGNGVGLANLSDDAIVAENNWWGCNAGPASAPCDPITTPNAGTVDSNPWLVMEATAAPPAGTPLTVSDTVDIDTQILKNSDGDPITPPAVPAGTPVSYASSNGPVMSIAPASNPLDAAGLSDSTATADDPGDATVSTTIDGQTFNFAYTVDGGSTRFVSTTGNDNAGANNCLNVGSPCLTVAQALDKAGTGDTIQIEDGSYPEASLAVSKRVNIVGQSTAGTIVGPTAGSDIDTFVLGDDADSTSFSDLTVRSRSGGTSGGIRTNNGATSVDDIAINSVDFIGTSFNTGYGIYFTAPAVNWTIDDSNFEAFLGGIWTDDDVTVMSITGGTFFENRYALYSRRDMVAPTARGTFDGLTVTGSVIEKSATGVYFEGLSNSVFDGVQFKDAGQTIAPSPASTRGRGFQLNLKRGDYENITITDSRVTGSLNEGVSLQVRGYPGDATYRLNPATLDGFTVENSTIRNNTGPGFYYQNVNPAYNGPFPTPSDPVYDYLGIQNLSINDNRIVGNGTSLAPPIPPATGVSPETGLYAWDTVDAQNNWWGCNEGPLVGGPDCDTANATTPFPPLGDIDADPWLVLKADPTSATLPLDGTVDINASIDTDSDGNPAGPLATGPQVDYASDDTFVATVAPATDNLDASGLSSTTVSALDNGPVTIGTTVDNETVNNAFLVDGGPQTRYVETGGDDDGGANSCRDDLDPCATLQHAVDRADSGDTIDSR